MHTVSAGNPHWRPSHPVDNDVIEGEYEVHDPPRPDGPSGWTRH
jgi:hypothetical protein